jgi:hypothetical protein
MALLRPLEQQFEAETVTKIRLLIEAFRALDVPAGPGRYYMSEIARSLEAGLLLAAIELSASLLELVVRELVARLQEQNADPHQEFGPYFGASTRRLDLEYDRRLMFTQLLDKLESSSVVKSEDAALVRKFYKETRIPLHHGLPGRYVSGSQASPSNDLIAVLSVASLHSFEEALEQRAIKELDCVVNFIAAYDCG